MVGHAHKVLSPGHRLGKYDLIQQIAVGGMAELYLARTMGIEGFEKLVVIKRILPALSERKNFVQMFLEEARLAATLHHPNIAQVYDIGVVDGDYFFTMEYIHGEDLRRLNASAHDQGVPVSLDAALTLACGVCAGLHYAHQKSAPDGQPLGIVHRDVSPSNILVSYDGAVKVVDFGIARASSRESNTGVGGLKGKIAYMSPEQCRGNVPVDRRSDLFSIGTMLYELTTGTLPFDAETELAILGRIVNEDAEPPRRRVPAYPPQLEAIVMRAMARDPDRRYPTALELQRDLEDFAHENRLRISALTLAGVMERLFPAALAEWEKAQQQGAYFVEAHVIQTLVRSGKTMDLDDDAVVDAESDPDTMLTGRPVAVGDDDHTEVVANPPRRRALPPTDPPEPDTLTLPMNAPAFTPNPDGLSTHPGRPSALPPPPSASQAPAASRLMEDVGDATAQVALPSVLRGIPLTAPPERPDVTQRVVPLGDVGGAPTRELRRGGPGILVVLLILVVAASATVTIVVLERRTRAPAAAPPPAADHQPSVVSDQPEPEPEQPAVSAEPGPVPGPVPVPDPAPTPPPPAAATITEEPPKPATTKAAATKPAATKPARSSKKSRPSRKSAKASKPAPAPAAPKPEPPKEKPWSADSPFMPVRPDK